MQTRDKIAYLASPYTHADMSVKTRRFELAARAAAKLMEQGEIVFSPIAMTHPMAVFGPLHGTWDFWKRFDTAFVQACDELWVLMLTGWDKSVGVCAEIALACEMGKPIRYINPCDLGVELE